METLLKTGMTEPEIFAGQHVMLRLDNKWDDRALIERQTTDAKSTLQQKRVESSIAPQI